MTGGDRGRVRVAIRIVPPGSAAFGYGGNQQATGTKHHRSSDGRRNSQRKIVSLLKNPGETIALDDEFCEVETDKAVYPIQSSFAGVMGEWKTKVGDTVEIGQELGHDYYHRAIVCGPV